MEAPRELSGWKWSDRAGKTSSEQPLQMPVTRTENAEVSTFSADQPAAIGVVWEEEISISLTSHVPQAALPDKSISKRSGAFRRTGEKIHLQAEFPDVENDAEA